MKQISLTDCIFDSTKGVFVAPDMRGISYKDSSEEYLLRIFKNSVDLRSDSKELERYIRDWPTKYHLSVKRANLLRCLDFLNKHKDKKVLELGAGCGAITRWLGENIQEVHAVEGDLLRASIAKERCKDLKNVKIFCANIQNLRFKGEYDVVTLIGVLEYAPLFYDCQEGPLEASISILRQSLSALKSQGILILAIENKIGLKYWAGCREDHTGKLFEGIHGYPNKRSPLTFSKKEISELLKKVGFKFVEYYYPFPDYKLPEVIISDESRLEEYYVYNWLKFPFEDPFSRAYSFHEALALRTLTQAGLFPEFANSFLIIASPCKSRPYEKPDWIVKKIVNHKEWNENFHHEILLRRCGNKLRVFRNPLSHSTSGYYKLSELEYRLKEKQAFVAGDLFIFRAYEAICSNNFTENLIAVLMRLKDYLLYEFHIGKEDEEGYPLLKGDAIDCTLWNIIENQEGLFFFDKKWRWLKPVPIDFVLFRSLFYLLSKATPYLNNIEQRDVNELIILLLRSLFPHYGVERHARNLRNEQYFQSLINSERAIPFTFSRAPKCSIIMPVFNRLNYTKQCLDILYKITPHELFELIVINNASTDGTKEFLNKFSQLYSNTKVIHTEENMGFTKACNMGAKIAAGEYLVFLNNDTLPRSGWLNALITEVEKDGKIGAVGAKLIYPNGKLQEAGGIIFNDGTGWNFGRFDDPKRDIYSESYEVDYCSGACLLVRKDVFWEIGGFDERYSPAYYEDTDLCFTLRKLGYKVVYCPRCEIVHFEGATASKDPHQGFKRFQEINRKKFVEKWKDELKVQGEPYHVTGSPPTTANRNVRLRLVNLAQAPSVPRILVVDPFLPVFDRASGSNRLLQILKILRGLGFNITFLSIAEMTEVSKYKGILEELGIETFLSHHLNEIDWYRFFKYRDFTFAIISFYYLADKILPLIRRFSPHTKTIVDSVDVHFLREMREAEILNDPYLAEKAMTTRAKEIEVYSKADGVIAITENDKKVLLNESNGSIKEEKVFVVPNIHAVRPTKSPFEKREGLLFIGNFNHSPNVDAMRFFCQEVFPKVVKELKDIKLYIVGSNPPPPIRELENENVAVTGYVPDLEPYMEKAKVFVAPLRYGAGMKGKIGEALSHGLPVVTTSVGAEGMDLEDGVHVIIADDADAFASAVVRVYTDERLWKNLRENGVLHVQKMFTPEVVTLKLKEMFEILNKNEDKDRRPSLDARVSVIVVHYKGIRDTLECLSSLKRSIYKNYQIIVIVNGAGMKETEELIKAIEEEQRGTVIHCDAKNFIYPEEAFNREIVLIENENNAGFAGANNVGMRYALECGAEYFWLLNNDAVVEDDALHELVKFATFNPKAGLCCSKVYCFFDRKKVQYNGERIDPAGMEDTDEEEAKIAAAITGCSLFIRREVVEKVGLLEEDYFLYFEDNDFAVRAFEAGWQNYYVPFSKIYHKGGSSIGEWLKTPLSVYYATRNRLLFAHKRYPQSMLVSFDLLRNSFFPQIRHDRRLRFAFAQGVEDFIYGKRGKSGFEFEKIDEIIKKTAIVRNKEMHGTLEEKFAELKGRLIYAPEGDDVLDNFLNLALGLYYKRLAEGRKRERLVEELCRKGEEEFRKGNIESAEVNFKKALEEDPNSVLVHNDLSSIYWQKGQLKEALEHLQRAMELDPEDRDVVWNCGQIMAGMGRLQDAYEVYQSYLQRHRDEEMEEALRQMEGLMKGGRTGFEEARP